MEVAKWTSGSSYRASVRSLRCLRRLLPYFDLPLIDGLMPAAPLEVWPDCYFREHAWPPNLQRNPNPYAAELYVRGIDSYVWAEGYVVRGPNAGWFATCSIPYLPLRQETGSRKVFAGPYPE